MYLIRALGRTRTYDGISTAELQSAPFAAQVTSAYKFILITGVGNAPTEAGL